MTILRTVSIDVSLPDTAVELITLLTGKRGGKTTYQLLSAFLSAASSGRFATAIQARIAHGGACAHNTLTAAGAVSDGDTAVIAGITFTAKTAPDLSTQVQFKASTTNTVAMANLQKVLSQHPVVSALVIATVSSSTITLTARTPGKWAEAQVTTTATGGIAATGAALASSTEATLDSAAFSAGDYTPLTS